MNKTDEIRFIPITGSMNKIIVLRDKPIEITNGGIILGYKDPPNTGIVISISEKDDVELKAGDKIQFSPHGGTPVKIDDVEYLVMIERDVLLKFI